MVDERPMDQHPASPRKNKMQTILWIMLLVAGAYGAQSAYISYTVGRFLDPWAIYQKQRSHESDVMRGSGEPDFCVDNQTDLDRWLQRFRPYGSVVVTDGGKVLIYCVIFRGDEAVVYLSVDRDDRVESVSLGV